MVDLQWLLYTGITTHSPPVMSSHIIIHSSKASDFTPVRCVPTPPRSTSPPGRYNLSNSYVIVKGLFVLHVNDQNVTSMEIKGEGGSYKENMNG